MAGELTSAGGLPRYEASQPVSVVLICHNKTGALAHVIAGFARNTRRPDLVVLSDDASTDGSPELVERLCDQHGLARLVVRHGPDGRGFRLNTLRNDGISACPEGLVVILDADHVPARTHLEAHRELHLRYDVPTLYSLKGEIVRRGVKAITGIDMHPGDADRALEAISKGGAEIVDGMAV